MKNPETSRNVKAHSDSVNRGSTPRPPANDFKALEKPPFEGLRIVGDFVT